MGFDININMKLLSSKIRVLALAIVIFVGTLCILVPYRYTSIMAQNHIYSDVKSIPFQKVGLLLGTSKFRPNNTLNLFYKNRIAATILLYREKKINHILISGDNAHRSYNEPNTILKDLLKAGIPRGKITLDYAGFRTLDSVIRAHLIFGQKSFTIISQQFHNERALYIAHQYGIQANAYNAKTPLGLSKMKMEIREHLARILMFWDIIYQTEQKFLGSVEII